MRETPGYLAEREARFLMLAAACAPASGVVLEIGSFKGRRAGVASFVDSHLMFSRELARTWNHPIRLLWIDGDHTYAAAQGDLALFRPHLARGGIVAMHDVLGTWEGPLRVFIEDVLQSDEFGPAGFCGSIGWAQYRPGEGRARRFRWSRRRLAWPARHLIPVARAGRVAVGVNKWRYKLWRALAPHHAVDPARWVAKVALPGADSLTRARP